jgi:tetratricopeptide (TPR) repeat protein
LHEEGKTPLAISQLRRLPPSHPQYSEAMTLIAQWELAEPEEEVEAPPPPAEIARRQEGFLREARDFFARGENLSSSRLLREAMALAPLAEGDTDLYNRVQTNLEPLSGEIDLFKQGEWEFALPRLWRLNQEDPQNKDVVQLIVDCYFNLGVRDLQRGELAAAKEKFSEAQTLDPDDIEVERLVNFVTAYGNKSPDLLYRIFVKYLPFR